jgi:hypothetical protein
MRYVWNDRHGYLNYGEDPPEGVEAYPLGEGLAPAAGLGEKILHHTDQRSLATQLGEPVKTWAEAKAVMARKGIRVAERGEQVLRDAAEESA